MELKKYRLEGEYPQNTAKHHPEKESLEFLHDGTHAQEKKVAR